MTEQERRDKGIYVECFGHGEFQVLKSGVAVIMVEDSEDKLIKEWLR